ncbi:PAAR domain-containing protein [Pseudoduganella plicata]|uniref:Type IV secretion protein Rhs n=1 Tax=Pseudoduganella plicata TaxID=321984 RepID=A0AA88C9V9_9BURK|nr:PAAR domain-containing protein [Pseudoduganella plicata]GGZ02160.1 hypothetical protein GCM10007388_39950 [Pseudoduganella plicata]
MPAAARLTDPIGHSPTMSWLLKGLLIGAAIAVTGVLIAGTGGLAAVAIVGGAAAMGAGLGEAMSTMSFAPKEVSGAISLIGSTDVFINGLAAARAHVDMVLCSKHPGPPIPIATGSGQVYINGQPAARVDDKTGCGGDITKGSGNVYIGGGTQQTDTINPENLVPEWVHVSLLAVGVGSAVVLAGPVIAIGGLVGAFAGGYGGSWLGGKVFGEGSDGQKWSAIAGSFLGGFLGAKAAPAAWRFAQRVQVKVEPGTLGMNGGNVRISLRPVPPPTPTPPVGAGAVGDFTEVRFGPNGEVYAKLPAPSNPGVMRWQRMNGDGMSNRDMYMGSTPSKDSSIGLQVQNRMRREGALTGSGDQRMVLGEDGQWYPIQETDMGHVQAAVDYWNAEGRYYGPRSPEVRQFMNDPDNYWLEPSSINRSKGALMRRTYETPATEAEVNGFFGIDDLD